MELSGILMILLVVLLLSAITTYAVLATTRPSAVVSFTPNHGPLNPPKRLGASGEGRDAFLVPAGATFSVYLYCYVNNKTPEVGNTQTPITLFRIGDAVQLQLLPGGVSMAPSTRLVVKTQNPDPSKPKEEVFEVEPFPQQKWVHTVLVREGRRYTLYYNGKVTSSQRTVYYPTIDSASIQVGDSRLKGEYSFPKVVPTPYSIEEIQRDLVKTSDTRYEPYRPMDWGQLFSLKLGCPEGIFCFSTTGPPKESPLKSWQTPYA